ncbi:hypothetical protein [Nocardioides flavescens]|uniref:DUF3352 domain-containing protein n=1 Tax=Nocardioides flavescens TaxID=2691959 RepID=A0A6L7ET40_9ACTN|nr:hypothetical protein [Nocardioides flavescens]MXG89870.1 hypothetical protein [Nocardioides flavescens]
MAVEAAEEETRSAGRRGPSRTTVIGVGALAVLLVAAAAVVGVRWWRETHRSELDRAVALAPASTQRFSWTDWAAVREELGARVAADSSADDVEEFLSDAYDADLSSASAMGESAATLQSEFGFSPADVEWELLAQSETGSVLVLRLPDSADLDALGDTLEALGYPRPSEADGVWDGGVDVVPRIAERAGTSLSPQFNAIAIDADEHLVLASDSAPYVRDAARDLPSRIDDEGVRDVVDAVGDPLSASIYTGDFACRSLAMAQADDVDQADADQLLAAAGRVDPLTGFAIATEAGGGVRVAMAFEDDGKARRNADSRSALASGPAPGQGGDFGDRFDLGQVRAEGRVVTLDLDPVDDSPVLSDLATGPVLFATC